MSVGKFDNELILQHIEETNCTGCRGNNDKLLCNDCIINYLKVIVRKDTKQPVLNVLRRYNGLYGECPVCGGKCVRMEYCQKCGQHLKW